ncbi:DUF6544 family protein [Enterococcus ureasiticus]|uniref:Uncharacterized protein n=1 Tax=Enterococcus ureasiticus TaxID=903984 RepID=A0A1E5GG72_9ENTE|nr:DUF6544 family protein [Enterococcus ureasiticus]OEG11712.1 hypothetical protein BCR21_09000 [Enterococcus ureasiticus]
MGIVLGMVIALLGGFIIFMNIPYSPVVSEFRELQKEINLGSTNFESKVFTMKDIAYLPKPVQNYFIQCGFIGKRKMKIMNAKFYDADFILNKGSKPIKINYFQSNVANAPIRLALIDTSIYGLPFQGIDKYIDGAGSMKGVLGKVFTLFDEGGTEFEKASLATYLAECFLVPSAILENDIAWEEIDEYTVKAIIHYKDVSVSGIFTFNKDGEVISFFTKDRMAISTDGTKENAPWSATFKNYISKNGVKNPSRLQGIWHYSEGDSIYFDGKLSEIKYE